MNLRSYDDLDFPLAWKRVLKWVGDGQLGVPDRLPFGVLKRLYGMRGPRPRRDHHFQAVTMVFSAKKSATARPFPRISPRDLLVYQALVDRLAADIERALAPRDVVVAYRQTTGREHDAFAKTPTRAQYAEAVEDLLLASETSYALTGDVAGYFLHIDIDELERLLLSASRQVDVVRDLAELLRTWQTLGVRGLPQGIRPSSPLGNLYLSPLDALLLEEGVRFVRWMDDWVIVTRGFHEARRVQDLMERYMYGVGLTLAADKTRIVKWDTVAYESRGATQHLNELKEQQREAAEAWIEEQVGFADYPPSEPEIPDPEELDREVVIGQLDELLAQVRSGEPLPADVHSTGIAVFREMQGLGEPHGLAELPRLLTRVPSLTKAALDFVAAVAPKDIESATAVFAELFDTKRFMLDVEKLDLCAAVLKLPEREVTCLAPTLARWVRSDPNELVRARALLAWGTQSTATDFDLADEFWDTALATWQPYVLIAIQNKARAPRDRRYREWSGEGRFTGLLVRAIQDGPFGWRKL